MKLRNYLKRINGCQREAYWTSLQLDSEKSFAFVKMVAFRDIVKEFSPETLMNKDAVRTRLNQYVNDQMFSMKYERDANVEDLVESLYKFGENFSSTIIDYAPETKIANIEGLGNHIEICPDLLINDKPLIIKSKKDRLKTPQWTVELYLYAITFGEPIVYCVKEKVMVAFDFNLDEVESEAMKLIEDVEDVYPSPFAPIGDAIYEKCEKCIYRNLCLFEDVDIHEDEFEKIAVKKGGEVKWTDEQKVIIENTETGEFRVLAGAGSGKTSVLTERMLRVGEKVGPEHVLALTFTKAGVEEIKNKLSKKETSLNVEKFNVQTFNGFCAEIIDENYQAFGFNNKPKLIDAEFQSELVGKILDRYPIIRGMNYMYPYLTIANGCIYKTLNLISRFKRRGVSTADGVYADLIDEPYSTSKIVGGLQHGKIGPKDMKNCETIIDVFNEYVNYCEKNCLIDYEDQINLLSKYLPSNPELVKKIKNRYNHVIVDEFQDTSNDQMIIIKDFIYDPKKGNSLLVCGDDSQSIYKFRDVDATNIIQFENYFPNTKTLKLTRNFRSAQKILDIATKVISKSDENIDKNLIANNRRLKASITNVYNIVEVINQIELQIKSGVELNDIAVLCATRKECVEIHKELTAINIPNVIVVSNNIKDDNQVQAMISLAKFLDERNTDVEANLFDLAVWLHKSDPFVFESQYTLKDFITGEYTILMDEYNNVNEDERYEWFMSKILEAFPSHSKGLQVILDRETEVCDNNIYRLFDFLRGVDKGKINVFTPSEDTKLNAITITTIHASKGKEWRAVNIYAPSLNRRIATVKKVRKSKKDKDNTDQQELIYDNEKIRLLFVAITRAKEYLTLFVSDHIGSLLID